MSEETFTLTREKWLGPMPTSVGLALAMALNANGVQRFHKPPHSTKAEIRKARKRQRQARKAGR